MTAYIHECCRKQGIFILLRVVSELLEQCSGYGGLSGRGPCLVLLCLCVCNIHIYASIHKCSNYIVIWNRVLERGIELDLSSALTYLTSWVTLDRYFNPYESRLSHL